MWNLPDISLIFYLAVFGLVCAILLLVGGGIGAVIWAYNHLQIV